MAAGTEDATGWTADATTEHENPDSSLAPVVRYMLAAGLVRCAEGGAAVGLIMLALEGGMGGPALGGVLAALLTAPYIAGPWLGRWVDGAKDSRLMLAGAFAIFGLGLAGGALLLGRAPIIVTFVLIGLAGLTGPLQTGGLSSRLAGLVGPNERRQRKAEGWDAATYGLANIVGPATVAGVAAVTTPLVAVLALGAIALVASVATLTLPTKPPEAAAAKALSLRAAMRAIVTIGPLRRIMIANMLNAVSMGGVMVIAVVFGSQLSDQPSAGAALATAYGIGNIIGSVAVALFPMRGEPEKLTLALILSNGIAVALCAVTPSYLVAVVTFALAGATSSLLFTATLTVRSTYSPPNARAQVFVTMAGTKMALASVGTVLAGTLVGLGPRLALTVGASVSVAAVVLALVDRRLTIRPEPDSEEVS